MSVVGSRDIFTYPSISLRTHLQRTIRASVLFFSIQAKEAVAKTEILVAGAMTIALIMAYSLPVSPHIKYFLIRAGDVRRRSYQY